ncbi:oxysterol-binding protein-related protein 7-like, partial [Malurus melanocephalus]|uniref:oxysterol-binding protein-related protein 7-like n=1 Tax=Malurus melanocephalus TaxID=175006 RepID=UPI00254864E4
MQSPPRAGQNRGVPATPCPSQAGVAGPDPPDPAPPPRSGPRPDGPAAPGTEGARPGAPGPLRPPAMGSHEKEPCSPRRAPSRSNSTVSSKHSSAQQGSESWEVLEEPRARGSPGQEPRRHEGYLLKKRKWPLKGWHKRYFVLENGILKYSTTRQDVSESPGCGPWTRILPSGSAPALSALSGSRDRVDAWLKDSEGLERCSAELSECQAKLQELTGMLQHLEALHRIPSAPLISGAQPSAATERPKKGRRSTKIWCTQSFAKDDTIGRVRVGRLHGSVPNLSRYLEPPQSQLPFGVPPEYSQLQRSFWVLAQKVHGSLSSVVAALVAERARLEEMRQALDRQCPAARTGSGGNAG